MKSKDAVQKCVAALIGRRKRLLFLRRSLGLGGLLSLLLASLLAALLLYCSTLFEGWTRIELAVLALGLMACVSVLTLCLSGVCVYLSPCSPVFAAKCLDDCYSLKDQVASVVDLGDVDRELVRAARLRAAGLVADARPSEVFPLRSNKPRSIYLLLISVIILGLSILLFEEDLSAARVSREIAALADRLRRFALEREKDARTEEQKKALERLKKLAEQLKQKKISKKKALEEAASLRKALGKKQQQVSMKGLDLRKAAEALAKCKDTKPIAKQFRRRDVRKAADEAGKLGQAVKERRALKENAEFEKLDRAFRMATPHMGPFSPTSKRISGASKFYERDMTGKELKNLAEQLKANADAAELSDLLKGSMRELDMLQEGLGNIKEFKRGAKGNQGKLAEFMSPGGG